ncbi:RagB/SusD family nutrient uptake outer membrane protein [Pricia sp. S334]|uniref:RagB/SusD family nutrient uptake outer membrane protein n=1 Tax=Pricia mediterranea TaxID=3076079 RepID=A0ABU3L7I3_9FLAO|nr:RagB/SusD family nutrient uptake outer membrane protein [Pricia sp. S334]MDT7829427.1 RagB/SusD family nutrient uptake outer membrane protein [Pricia sp. S334]
MNRKKLLILPLVLLSITMACDDYLEEELVSDVSAGQYYTDEAGLEDALVATYSWLKGFYGPERGFTMTTFGTDIFTNGSDGSHKAINLYDGSLNASQSYMNEAWRDWYRGINQANAVLNRATDIEMDEAKKTLRLAEARWLRAFYYFDIVRTYGDAYLTLDETTGVETEVDRSPASEIYAQAIVPDLEFAIANLENPGDTEYGRTHKAAAEFLLAKVLLRRSYTDYAAGDDASRAETLLSNVINNYGFELLDNYGNLWDITNQENSEIVWNLTISKSAVDDGTDDEGHRGHLYFLMEYDKERGMSRDVANGRPWKRFRPTDFFLDLFNRDIDTRYDQGFKHVWYANQEVSDDRGNLMVGDTAIYIPGPGKDVNWPQARKDAAPYLVFTEEDYTERIYPTVKKWLDPTRPDRQKEQGQRDVVLMRLADAYLLRAEAKLQQNNPGGAADDINVVRTRAAVEGEESAMQITAADVDLEFLLNERAREMYGEHARWFDLTRTRTLVERVRLHNPQAAPNIQDYHVLRPIGQDQIDRTVGGYPQNPGYPQ